MDLPDVRTESQPSQICIIGGGAAGCCALKIIMQTPQYKAGDWLPTLFEERERPGGIWIPSPPTDGIPPLSPVYDSLTTNLPHSIMSFTDFPFPPSSPVFPKATTVEDYLQNYVSHFNLAQHMQMNTKVHSVSRVSDQWSVTLSNGETSLYDLVLVCNGHFRTPRIPTIPGLDRWLERKKAIHSAWYRRPDNYGSTVLVIGGGPSGRDISLDLAPVSHRVIHSTDQPSTSTTTTIIPRGRVERFEEDGVVHFLDGSTESSVDFCILATGYKMDFPFLPRDVIIPQLPPPVPPLPEHLYNSTYHVFPLARHIAPMQNSYPPSSLAFIGLLYKIAPFPIFEAQLKAALRVFADPTAFNYTEEAVDIMTRYEKLRTQSGSDDPERIANLWHKFEVYEQFEYRDTLCRFAEGGLPFPKTRVADWEPEFYENRDSLRQVWENLQKAGKAEEFVAGVGENGVHEWVALLRKMLTMVEKTDVEDAQNKPRL